MQIAELMRLIPDDGTVEIKNNSGKVIITIQLYKWMTNLECKLSKVDEYVTEGVINSMVEKIKEKIHANS